MEADRTAWRPSLLLAASLLALAALAAYGNSFNGAFVFDDIPSIAENPTIRQFWPPGPALQPPAGGLTVSGRPLVNFSLALNFALGGTAVAGYHALNLAIHFLAGLVLFGVVRRTLRRWRTAVFPDGPAFVIALLWLVHPLQTEAVTYVVQRAESLMGLFYLLTLYCFVRSTEEEGSSFDWQVLSIVCCLGGMATKEVMVTAPLLVLLYDRTFVAGSFRAAWRQHRGYYGGLAATWGLLAWLVAASGGNRGGTVGLGVDVGGDYALTQFQAIASYLGSAVWPCRQVFEYGTFWVKSPAEVLPYAAVVLPLVVLTGVALWRWPAAGFLGAWFFGILAPTSLVPGVSQMIVEHRMYLPLAAVISAGVWAAAEALSRFQPSWRLAVGGAVLLAGGLAFLTFQRNRDYRSERALWSVTVAQRPQNSWAQCNLGVALFAAGQIHEAIARYRTALTLNPRNAEAQWNLADALAQSGQVSEALAWYAKALREAPNDAKAHCNLGNTLFSIGRATEAIAEYVESLRLNPNSAKARNDLGHALASIGRVDEAVIQYRRAFRLTPEDPAISYNLGSALAQAGRLPEAVAVYRTSLRLRPDYPEARNNLANALARQGEWAAALPEYAEAVRLRPDYVEARYNWAMALQQAGRPAEARRQWEEVLRRRPGFAPAGAALAAPAR